MPDPANKKLDTLERLYDAARFLKRCNVRAFSSHDANGAPSLGIELVGGKIDDWRALWSVLEEVGGIVEHPKQNIPREHL